MSTISTGTIATTAFVVTGDTTGNLVVKTGSSAATALTVSATGNLSLATGNLTFSSTGQRITGDMSNATATSRLAFQSSTTNGNTIIQAIPNGTATQTNLLLYANTDLSNSAALNIFQNATESTIRGIALGTGAYTPLTFYTGGSERFRIGTAGQMGVGGANYGTSGQVLTSNGAAAAPSWQLPAGLPTMNIVSGTTQAAIANNHYVLTNAAATTVTLPASPAAGDVVWITVSNGRVDNVVARNGQNINSIAEDMTVNNAYAGIQLRYADVTRGWVFT